MYVGKEREGLCSWHTTMHGGGTSLKLVTGGRDKSLWDAKLGGGTNRCDRGMNLSGSWQQGHSATYNTPSRI
uniref:Uncharacterized protein n=1 Tax=Nelumbo nucifera TaxID=4432 RepID=A0A822ZUL1_NELNU|nr:TPA_asm: hypothetical protein HUJ06_017138 [Nelumbo nucifera]